jgi:hypothetical protein
MFVLNLILLHVDPLTSITSMANNTHFAFLFITERNFNPCTTPVLLFEHWYHIFGEFFTHGPSWTYHLQKNRAFDRNVTFALASCGSVPLEDYHLQLMQPFSAFPVTSWTNLASKRARRRPGSVRGTAAAEGKPRCYKQLLVLGYGNAAWPYSFEAGQSILQYYKDRLMVPNYKLFRSGPDTLKVLFEYRSPDTKVRTDESMRQQAVVLGS